LFSDKSSTYLRQRERAQSLSALLSGRPALAEKYVPALVAELEEELRQRPDEGRESVLESIKRGLERTRASG
jgi:hypothetical protein